MPKRTAFLGTKVARRQLLLFVLCALLPISALALVSYRHVTRQLTQESRARLRQASKATGMAIIQRLQLLDAELALIATGAKSNQAMVGRQPLPRSSEGFAGLAVANQAGPTIKLAGDAFPLPALSEQQLEHLRAGNALLVSAGGPETKPRLLMARLLDPPQERSGVLWGEISTSYLLNQLSGVDLPHNTEACVLLEDGRPLLCTQPGRSVAEHPASRATTAATSFEWAQNGQRYIAGSWKLPLKPSFLADTWTVVLSEPRARVLAPLADFNISFVMVLILSLWVVLLLSNVQIRRSLEPLEHLQEATRRLARREFGTPVVVSSGDEFQDLAASFNDMSQRLERQFRALATSNEIDRSILTALERAEIIELVLQRAPEIFPSNATAVMVLDWETGYAQTYGAMPNGDRTLHGRLVLSESDRRALAGAGNGLIYDSDTVFPEYLQPTSAAFTAISRWLALPIMVRDQLAGALALGYTGTIELSEDDRTQAYHLVDQIAVGLSNADLIQELAALNLGALTALARVIDAKSPWTAGHSERVTTIAMGIGQHLGLNKSQLETLRRGALLHDIGKIGISMDILDKPGRLTPEETMVMQQHVRIGARILEPIPKYSEVIPVVLHHHERFDGLGYPDKLAGEAIHLHARILAVADTYDALSSDRPYRPGLERSVCAEIIRRGSGKEFDPVVVEALLAYLAETDDEVGHFALPTRGAA